MNRRYLALGGVIVVAVLLVVVVGGMGGNSGDADTSVAPAESAAAANPWKSDLVTVTVVDETSLDRDWAPVVTDAVGYWNGNMSALGYEGRLVYTGGRDADVTIRVVDDVGECDGVTDPLGCAPVYNGIGTAVDGDQRDEQDIKITGHLQNNVTSDLLKHELGHTLGVTHREQDEWRVMRPGFATPQYDAPNATEVVNPWDTTTVTVYYNRSGGELTDQRINQLEAARSYYDVGAGGFLPDTISVERTRDPTMADIEIRMVDNVESGISRWVYQGYDPDNDNALEEYEEGTVYIERRASPEVIIWHAGHGIGRLFGVKNTSGLPSPFDESKEFDSRSWKV